MFSFMMFAFMSLFGLFLVALTYSTYLVATIHTDLKKAVYGVFYYNVALLTNQTSPDPRVGEGFDFEDLGVDLDLAYRVFFPRLHVRDMAKFKVALEYYDKYQDIIQPPNFLTD